MKMDLLNEVWEAQISPMDDSVTNDYMINRKKIFYMLKKNYICISYYF